jgi:hypothetical protein
MSKWMLGTLVLAAALGGCYVQGDARVAAPAPQPVVVASVQPAPAPQPVVQDEVVEQEPPAPQVYVAAVRPGFIYIDGRWRWEGRRWVWREGYYERERAGFLWEPGRWTVRGRGHVWVEGRWRRR